MDRIKIISHPVNIALLRKKFEPKPLPEDVKAAIYKPYGDIGGIEFIESPYMEQYKWNGKWLLADKYKNDRFVEWWDGYSEPATWMIHFGVVVKEMIINFIKIDESKRVYTHNPFIPAMEWGNRNFIGRSCF